MAFDEPVSAWMTTPVETVGVEVELSVAQVRMEQRGISAVGVVDFSGALVGVLSRSDLLRVGRLRASMGGSSQVLQLPRMVVRERMRAPVLTALTTEPLSQAAARIVEAKVHRLFVSDAGGIDGVLSIFDLSRAVARSGLREPLHSLATSPVLTIDARDTVASAIERLAASSIWGLVVTEDEWPIGIFTQREALSCAGSSPETHVEEAMSCAMLCLPHEMPVARAAALAIGTGARRVLVVAARQLIGIVTGFDFARFVANA